MSRLADKIKRVGRVESAPLGFGLAAKREAAPTLMCLLRLEKDQVGKANAADADAVIISGLEPSKLADAVKAMGDAPVGVRLSGAGRDDVASARGAGADFVLLDSRSAAEALLEEQVGLALSAPADASDTALRLLAALPLDAIEVPSVKEPFTLETALELRRLSLLTQTPLLVEVPPDTDASRLQALRDAGAAGVILEARHADNLSALRETILALPPRGRRREERLEAILPAMPAPVGAPPEEDDEEDYE